MSDETMPIDPRLTRLTAKVWELARYAGSTENYSRLDAEIAQLKTELTAALQRLSRDEFDEKIGAFAYSVRLYGVTAGKGQRRELLDLACGPEPAPRGIPIRHGLLAECARRFCDGCPGTRPIYDEEGITVVVKVCTHPCHQEASDE